MGTFLTNRKLRRLLVHILSLVAMLAIVFPVTTAASALSKSPFLGEWQAVDVDGSEMALSIAGHPTTGPLQITWTDRYISYCDGEAGILRGTAWLGEGDENLLEADLHLQCFKSGATLEFHVTFRYHPATNTLSVWYSFGEVTIWYRPRGEQAQAPDLNLRVNYGHDWVESFYEAGHTVWITVTDSSGNVKATAEAVTAPQDFLGGEAGFQTAADSWVPAQPDIRPNDWVLGWVDNGATAQVQIGDISGTIDLEADSIQGTISAPRFPGAIVEVGCHSWGASLPNEIIKYDTVTLNGEDTYSCSWAGEWDIEPYQDVGVGYSDPDGHWVANAFFARNARIVASVAGDWFWTVEFNPGPLDLFIYESADEGAALLWSGQQEADQWGFILVGSDVHGLDLAPGNYLVISDGITEKRLVLETITMDVFDLDNEIMAGTAPAGRTVTVVAGMAEAETQARIDVTADPLSGAWIANFSAMPFDIVEDMRTWSFAQIFDEDGDANEANPPAP